MGASLLSTCDLCLFALENLALIKYYHSRDNERPN